MVYCRPASQFCCGCSLKVGVKVILSYGIIRNLCLVLLPVAVLIFQSEALTAAGSKTTCICLAGLGIAGLPLAAVAWWGVEVRNEPPVRLYWFYMVLNFLVDMGFVFKEFVLSGPCDRFPAVLQEGGRAFACGVFRGMNVLTILMVLSIDLYLMWVVQSYCEDLAMGEGVGFDLADLAKGRAEKLRQEHHELDHHILLKAGGPLHPQYFLDYGNVSRRTSGMIVGPSTTIFGTRHEMRYPPPIAVT